MIHKPSIYTIIKIFLRIKKKVLHSFLKMVNSIFSDMKDENLHFTSHCQSTFGPTVHVQTTIVVVTISGIQLYKCINLEHF